MKNKGKETMKYPNFQAKPRLCQTLAKGSAFTHVEPKN